MTKTHFSDCLAEVVGLAAVTFSGSICALVPQFWIWIRVRVWNFFKFENLTRVQTPATIDQTGSYPCFYIRKDHADSCCCLDWKVPPAPVLLRPVAQLYGQVRTDWNQCIVIDCSLSHPAGHKPFTCSHSVLRNAWLNIRAVRWMRFSARFSVHVFTISRNLTWSFRQ